MQEPIASRHLRDDAIGRGRRLLDVRCPAMVVSELAVVISSKPVAVLDLAGDCCRPAAPLLYDKSIAKHVRSQAGISNITHDWLFLAAHSHSSSFFHAVGEASTKLMWGLSLFHRNKELRVLYTGSLMPEILALLNLAGRGVQYGYKSVFARRITIPPSAELAAGPLNALRAELLAPLQINSQSRPSTSSLIVVRRAVTNAYGGRGMLNHDELMFSLRFVLIDKGAELVEWPETGRISEAMLVWSQADIAVCPHGAGTTNMLFMPRGSTIIEIIREGQKGRVYGPMASMLGHKFVSCVYRKGDGELNTSLPESIRAQFVRFTSFSLDLAWFVRSCWPWKLPPPPPAKST